MPTYEVKVAKRVDRKIDALDGSVRPRVIRAIQALKSDPRPTGCKKMAGSELWRIRVGDYRVVYSMEDAQLLVLVVRVGNGVVCGDVAATGGRRGLAWRHGDLPVAGTWCGGGDVAATGGRRGVAWRNGDRPVAGTWRCVAM